MTMKRTQYGRHALGHFATGSTIQTLEPGYYDIAVDQNTIIFAKKELNTDKLMRLVDTKSDQVINEIERFWTLKDRFTSFGLTFKRGILLYGNAGSGKTSTILVITKKMIEAGGVVINGSSTNPSYLKKALHDLREVEPERPLVVALEDIDSILKLGDVVLLSLLDGEASISNVVFIATTNYPEKLGARITERPSRFDQVVYIGMPSEEARAQYILHCDPKTTRDELKSWLALTDGLSIAQVKEVIVGVRCFGHTAEEIVNRLRSTTLTIMDEKKRMKASRDKTFFEKFYATCEGSLPPEQLKKIRDTAIGSIKAETNKVNQ